jgi:hypothetical protein
VVSPVRIWVWPFSKFAANPCFLISRGEVSSRRSWTVFRAHGPIVAQTASPWPYQSACICTQSTLTHIRAWARSALPVGLRRPRGLDHLSIENFPAVAPVERRHNRPARPRLDPRPEQRLAVPYERPCLRVRDQPVKPPRRYAALLAHDVGREVVNACPLHDASVCAHSTCALTDILDNYAEVCAKRADPLDAHTRRPPPTAGRASQRDNTPPPHAWAMAAGHASSLRALPVRCRDTALVVVRRGSALGRSGDGRISRRAQAIIASRNGYSPRRRLSPQPAVQGAAGRVTGDRRRSPAVVAAGCGALTELLPVGG